MTRNAPYARARAAAARFAATEDGSMTVHGLFMFTACCMLSAIGLDVTHFQAAKSQLQVVADASAHAAIVTRNRPDATAASARSATLGFIAGEMPGDIYGTVATSTDVRFGTYDAASGTFTPSDISRAAAEVTVGRTDANSNPVGTFLFKLVGLDDVDVRATAIYTAYYPPCLDQGFVANGDVDMQSNNAYFRGFCIHSNAYVDLNSNNFFQLGTVVSMPGEALTRFSDNTFTQNDGFADALREGSYDIRILDRLRADSSDPLMTAIMTPGSGDFPSYITNSERIPLRVESNSDKKTPASFTPGRIHTVICTGNRKLVLLGGTYANIVIHTDCPIQMDGDVRIENAILMTTNTSAASVSTPSGNTNGLELGRPDNCDTDASVPAGSGNGSAQILTLGGFRSAANLVVNGGQVIALGDINFASNAEGVGASFISDRRIDAESNISMSSCPTSPDENFRSVYFRLAR